MPTGSPLPARRSKATSCDIAWTSPGPRAGSRRGAGICASEGAAPSLSEKQMSGFKNKSPPAGMQAGGNVKPPTSQQPRGPGPERKLGCSVSTGACPTPPQRLPWSPARPGPPVPRSPRSSAPPPPVSTGKRVSRGMRGRSGRGPLFRQDF